MDDSDATRKVRHSPRVRAPGDEPVGLFTFLATRPGQFGFDPDQFRSFTAYVDGYKMGNDALDGVREWLLDSVSANAASLVWWALVPILFEEVTGESWDALSPRKQMWFLAHQLDTYLNETGRSAHRDGSSDLPMPPRT